MSEKQPELLPCPWCPPDEAGHSKPEARHIADMHGHAVICTHCAARGSLFGTEAEAIAAWNARPQSGALKRATEALRFIANLIGPNGERLFEGGCQSIAEHALAKLNQPKK